MLKSLFQSGKSSSKREKLEFLKKFEAIVEQSPQAIFITDLEGNIIYSNAKFTEIFGYTSEEIIGQNPSVLKTEHTPPEFYELLWKTIKGGEKWVGEFVNQRKDESIFYVHAEILPLVDESDMVTHYLAFEDDITHLKELEYELGKANELLTASLQEVASLKKKHQEERQLDQLTGLYDRSYLPTILPREVLRAIRTGTFLFLLLIDIDHFDLINQTYGFSIGDAVLKSFAARVMEQLQDVDIAIRIAGDKFLVLFSGKAEDGGVTCATKIKDYFELHPIKCERAQISLTISIGVSIYPVHTKQENDLLKFVEKALSVAKQAGGNQVTLWSENF